MKAVIFDLFGTLTIGNANPEARIIETYNLSLDCIFVEKLISGNKFIDKESHIKEIINGIGLGYSSETIKSISEILKKEIEKEKILPDCEGTLIEFKNRNYKIGLISNAPNPDYDIITSNGLRKYFDSIVYSYETGLLKPGQKIFELSLRQLKVDPKLTLMIGDSFETDIQGAKNVGIDGILISNKKIAFSDFHPYAVVPRLIDVLEVVENYFRQNKKKRLEW